MGWRPEKFGRSLPGGGAVSRSICPTLDRYCPRRQAYTGPAHSVFPRIFCSLVFVFRFWFHFGAHFSTMFVLTWGASLRYLLVFLFALERDFVKTPFLKDVPREIVVFGFPGAPNTFERVSRRGSKYGPRQSSENV